MNSHEEYLTNIGSALCQLEITEQYEIDVFV